MTLIINDFGEFVTPEDDRPNPFAKYADIVVGPDGVHDTRACPECGREFAPKTSNHRYCSAECRAKGKGRR